jgi:hypothetical protein
MRELRVLASSIAAFLLQRDIVLTAVGIVVGALIAWAMSWHYYVRALEDMQSDAKERQRVEALILRGIESVGEVKYERDSSGKVSGVAIQLRGQATGQSAASGTLDSESKPQPAR